MVKFRKRFVAALFFILLLCLIISKPPFLSPFRARIVDIFKLPLSFSSLVLKEIKSMFFYRKISKENFDLKKEIDILRQEIINSEEISQENKRLKKLLSFKYKTSFVTVVARVIARDSSNWVSAVVIDKGKKDKIQADMPVITESGLVGKVSEVGVSTSKIILISDPNLNIPSLIQRSREEGIISGTILGACKMRYISLDSDVKIGDKVITSGLGNVFPKGVLIGELSEIKDDPSGLMKLCLVDPSVNLLKIEEVLVIIK